MARPQSDIQRTQTGLRLKPDLVKALKHIAIDSGRPYNSLVEEAIEDYLFKHGHAVPASQVKK